MTGLPRTARVHVTGVIGLGAALLAVVFPRTIGSPILFGSLVLLSSATSMRSVMLPLAGRRSAVPVSCAVDFASMLLLGPSQAMLGAVVSEWSHRTFRSHEEAASHGTAFHMARLAITVLAAGGMYLWMGGIPGAGSQPGIFVRALAAAALTYFALHTAIAAADLALTTGQSVVRVWVDDFLASAPAYLSGAAAAALAAWLIVAFPAKWLIALVAASIYLTYRTYRAYLERIEDGQRHAREMADLHLATIEALALAIDAKDRTSQSHLRRVQLYATSVAKAMGMSANDVEGVKTAALLHDIGKLAVPEHILSKPGPLTPEEFQKIRAHPQVGADIVSTVRFPYPVAPLILSHHERWDGKGYPAGIKGTEIPLGARILSVVDYFDALMADRPYHKAMSCEAAVDLLEREAGKALDPAVVSTFLELLPTLQKEAAVLEQAIRRSHAETEGPSLGRPATGLAPTPSRKSVFEDIALAHREIYALYEIAQAMGTSLGVADTMALITAKLSNLVPYLVRRPVPP